MSEYEVDDYSEPDTWEDMYARDPVIAQYKMAQAAQAELAAQQQVAMDRQQVAAEAAAMLLQQQQAQQAQAQQNRQTYEIDRAMFAQYGQDWDRLKDTTVREFVNDPATLANVPAHDTQRIADALEQKFLEVKTANDPDKLEWDKVKKANQNSWSNTMKAHDAMRDAGLK